MYSCSSSSDGGGPAWGEHCTVLSLIELLELLDWPSLLTASCGDDRWRRRPRRRAATVYALGLRV